MLLKDLIGVAPDTEFTLHFERLGATWGFYVFTPLWNTS